MLSFLLSSLIQRNNVINFTDCDEIKKKAYNSQTFRDKETHQLSLVMSIIRQASDTNTLMKALGQGLVGVSGYAIKGETIAINYDYVYNNQACNLSHIITLF